MSRIKSSKTKPELNFKKKFKEFTYQPKVFGKPDFIDYKKKIAIFIDGCFWHKCPKHFKKPQSNKEYWKPKIERKNSGWKVKRIWEHNLKS